jgi:hypothetical protein
MGIATLVLGQSGRGKSTSIRNLNPETTMVIKAINKPFPFRDTHWKQWDKESQTGSYIVTDDYSTIETVILAAKSKGKSVIVVDDMQYLMANEFMRRSSEKSFDKFTDIAHHLWHMIKIASEKTDNDIRVYFLSHDEETNSGERKVKTIGKLLDEKICVEGMFSIVIEATRDKDGYFFATQNNGRNTLKSPMGLFDEELIDNDLNEVDTKICEYYNITK